MLLTVDIGNSQITCVLHDGAQRAAAWRFASETRRTADEYSTMLIAMMRRHEVALEIVSDIVLCSVVPSLTNVFEVLVERLFARRPLVVGPATPTGMEVRYRPRAALGPDRLADAVAGRALFGSPTIVVDMGTATTFNAVDETGDFVGGPIAPGVSVMAEALVRGGARLRDVELAGGPWGIVVGRNTEQSVRSGILYGHVGLVAGILARLDDELSSPDGRRPTVVATGGWSSTVAPLVERIDHIVPELLSEGLRLIHDIASSGLPRRSA